MLAAGVFSAEVTANQDSHYTLLIGVPEEVESYHAIAVLNYFGFPFAVEEDNILRQLTKYDMGF